MCLVYIKQTELTPVKNTNIDKSTVFSNTHTHTCEELLYNLHQQVPGFLVNIYRLRLVEMETNTLIGK